MKDENKNFIYAGLVVVVLILPWACGWKKRPHEIKATPEMQKMLERAKSQRPAH